VDELFIDSRDGSGFLRFHSREFGTPGGGSALEYFNAELKVKTMRAEVRVYAYGAQGLASLFEETAREWRGWKGVKAWESLEGELKLAATHDGLGHIGLLVEMGPPYEEWKAQGVVALEAGSLDVPARRLSEFVAASRSVMDVP
jgi:hypothetical protein